MSEITKRIRVYGIVQGVGFRPTVSRHATANGIRGNVCNKGPYVEIYAQGAADKQKYEIPAENISVDTQENKLDILYCI